MKTKLFIKIFGIALICLNMIATNSLHAQNELSAVDDTSKYSTIELIYMDKDLSVFSNLLTLSGLDTSLAFNDNEHTLFVPTNKAFGDMSIDKFAELTNPDNRAMLVEFVNRYFVSKKYDSYELKGHDIIDLNENKQIKIYSYGNGVDVGGANVTNADIESKNGIVHIVDNVITVTSK